MSEKKRKEYWVHVGMCHPSEYKMIMNYVSYSNMRPAGRSLR